MLALNRIQPRRKSNSESFREQTFKAKQNSSTLRHEASRAGVVACDALVAFPVLARRERSLNRRLK
jgi:hypothetical protein